MRNKGKKTIDETHPGLAAEWYYDKNGELSPKQITSGSGRNIWWKCENGHSFQLRVLTRTEGKTAPDYAPCPYCSHKRPTPGEYSLQTECPELMGEWDWEANAAEGLDPDNLLPRSARKAHWVCKKCGHRWTTAIAERSVNNHGCPECAKKRHRSSCKLITGVNDLATMCPDIAAEWSDENDKRPEEVHYGSSKSYWWKCSQGHEWKTRVNHRTKDGHGCPYCSGKKAAPENSIAMLYPEIAAEWDYEANEELLDGRTPEDFRPGSTVVAAWQCPDNPNHKYTMRISHRTEGFNCPHCSNHKTLPEESFAALYPHLLEEWDWDKNRELDPYTLAPGAHNIVWWKCSKGHEWRAAINDRARRGNGCAKCQPYGTSYAEQLFFFGVKTLFPNYNIENRYKTSFGKEIDVYIPELSLGFEPGSWYWHADKVDRDRQKVEECAEHGIKVIVVYEACPDEVNPIGEGHYAVPISFLLIKDGPLYVRDILKDALSSYDIAGEMWEDELWYDIGKQVLVHIASLGVPEGKSLAEVAPDLAAEWSPNNEFGPDQIYAKSNTKALWVCPKGHEYEKSPAKRMNNKGCPICSNHAADPRYNTVKKLYPEFLDYLSPDNEVDPDTVTPGCSTQEMLWVCSNCGHTFPLSPAKMFKGSATRCPSCNIKGLFPHTPFNEMDY